MLKKLGYSFDIEELKDSEVLVFNVIEDELAKIRNDDLKKSRMKR